VGDDILIISDPSDDTPGGVTRFCSIPYSLIA
jgi:hypothetical protein